MLKSLADDALRGTRVVVVDNSSDDRTAAVVACLRDELPFEIEYIPSENVGYGEGVNLGLRGLRPTDEAILVLNPDLQFVPGAISVLGHALDSDPSVGVVLPGYVDGDGHREAFWTELPTPMAYWRWSMLPKSSSSRSMTNERVNVEWGPGSCLMVRASAVRAVGGMDSRIFLYMEDADWCRRFLEAGWTVRFEPTALVNHSWGHAGNVDLPRRVLQTHLAKLYYFHKWYGRRGLLLVASQMFVESIVKSILGAVSRNRERRQGYLLLLRALPLAVAKGPIEAQNQLVRRD